MASRRVVRIARAVLLLTLGLAVGRQAQAEETARQILDRQRALDGTERRWTDRHEQLQMEVLSPTRSLRQMALDVFDRKYPDGQQKTMVYFSAPDSVKGTAFLAITHPDRPADQWLYLPEARRARRIGGEVRKQGFVGTDFTYHDLDLLAEMSSWTEATAASKLRGEERVDGVSCHVIELTPKREDIGYQQIVLWLGRDDLVVRQVEFFETAPSSGWLGFGGGAESAPPTRRMRQSDVRAVGAIPLAHKTEIETPNAGTKTVVTFARVDFDQDLPDDLFTQPAMEWGSYHPKTR
jgi:uncharacterized protein